MKMNKLLALAGIFIAAGLLGAQATARSYARDGAVITNSGSTNTAPFTIKVWSDASASASVPTPVSTIPVSLAQRFFADLRTARQSGTIEAHCMKSASFGTVTTVTWHGWHSADVSCANDPATQALHADTGAIESALRIGIPHRVRLPMEPRRSEPTLQPSPGPTPS
jgi:hypothetical protein